MPIDVPFLVEVQRKGWILDVVETESVAVRCPQPGCEVRTRFKSSTKIPEACASVGGQAVIVEQYDRARETLKKRRLLLGLSLPDIEAIIGCADDHIAKVERDNWNDPSLATRRMPNAQLLIDWANALGFDVAFVPRGLPRKALYVLTDTRDKLAARWRASGVVVVPSKPADDAG